MDQLAIDFFWCGSCVKLWRLARTSRVCPNGCCGLLEYVGEQTFLDGAYTVRCRHRASLCDCLPELYVKQWAVHFGDWGEDFQRRLADFYMKGYMECPSWREL